MSTLSTELNENGYPKNPNSLLVAIQRKFFPHLDDFRSRLGEHHARIGIPFRQNGRWLTMCGRVTKIDEFSDGVVIHFPQLLGISDIKMPDAILWVPNVGTIGVLSPQVEDATPEEFQAYMDEMGDRYLVASSTLRDIIEWLFKHQDSLPDSTTKEQVSGMTQFKQIELLERISRDRDLLGNTQVSFGEICRFVEEVDKDGFRTADDFGPAKA